ncbi:MAG: hypothetical protein QXH20_06130, partial [Candidatus Bathyarchaeia archaeon]
MLVSFGKHLGQHRCPRARRGQFVIIAALMIAIMIVSIAVVMYSTVSYYRYESWEEYMGLIDNVMAGSKQVLLSLLANYTVNVYEKGVADKSIVNDMLLKWSIDLYKAFPSYGLNVSFYERSQLVNINVYGISYNRLVNGFIKCYWY